MSSHIRIVMPAQAGIQTLSGKSWIPASAGMTPFLKQP
jgi:hypothetical protein